MVFGIREVVKVLERKCCPNPLKFSSSREPWQNGMQKWTGPVTGPVCCFGARDGYQALEGSVFPIPAAVMPEVMVAFDDLLI